MYKYDKIERSIGKTTDQAYPKVKPLTQALVAAAKEQGATVEDFRLACARVEQMIARGTSSILLSEFDREGGELRSEI